MAYLIAGVEPKSIVRERRSGKPYRL